MRANYDEFDDIFRAGDKVSSAKAQIEINRLSTKHRLSFLGKRPIETIYRTKPDFSCQVNTNNDIESLATLRTALEREGLDEFPLERASDIPPALDAEEWKRRERETPGANGIGVRASDFGFSLVQSGPIQDVNDLAAIIALANAAMNDEDPRKLGSEHVQSLRTLAKALRTEIETGALADAYFADASFLRDLADVIESYLPD